MILTRIVLGCCLIAVATPANAQPAGAQAEVLFREGRKLMEAKKYAEACATFEQSQKIEPAVTTLLNLAACHEKLGKIATAWGQFLEAERQTRSAADKATQQLNKAAHDFATALETRVPKLTISVPDKSKIDRLEILRDKESVPEVMWNRALPVDGGTYTITGRAPGTSDWSTLVTLATEADAKTVEIPSLQPLKRDPIERPKVAAVTEQPSKPLKTPAATGRRGSYIPVVVGIAVVGAVALLGGALEFSLWADSTHDKAKAEMRDQARRDSLFDSANHKRYVAEGLAVAGVGCAGVAAWLYLRQRGARTEPSSAHAGRMVIMPTASGIGIAGWF